MCHLCVTSMSPLVVMTFTLVISFHNQVYISHRHPCCTAVSPVCHQYATNICYDMRPSPHILCLKANVIFPIGTHVAPQCHQCVAIMSPLAAMILTLLPMGGYIFEVAFKYSYKYRCHAVDTQVTHGCNIGAYGKMNTSI